MGQSFRQCLPCLADKDCPSEKPHCAASVCAACVSNDHCATGICSGGACAPGCGAQAPCLDSLTACGATQRCEALECQADTECPTNAVCLQGLCVRRSCATDEDCDLGNCVNGLCFETLGRCHTQFYPP